MLISFVNLYLTLFESQVVLFTDQTQKHLSFLGSILIEISYVNKLMGNILSKTIYQGSV